MVTALKKAHSGDILELKKGTYSVKEPLLIDKKITIQSKNKKVKIIYSGDANTPAFRMKPKGSLTLKNVTLQGKKDQQAFATLNKNMSAAYNLWVENVEISDFKSVLNVSEGSLADTISITNTRIKNCLNGIELGKETKDKGDYNAEFVYVINSTFENVQKNVVNYYRGGYDESTIGGSLVIDNNSFVNCGEQEESEVLLKTRGIVNVALSNNSFKNNPTKYIAILWGEKGQAPENNKIESSGEIKIQQSLKQKLMY